MTRIYCSLLLLLWTMTGLAQKRDFVRTPNTNNIIVDANLKASVSLFVPHDNTNSLRGAPDSAGYLKFNPATQTFQGYYGSVKGWKDIGGGVDSTDVILPGGTISSTPSVGFNPGANVSVAEWIRNSYYQSQGPTAAISGGTTYELTSGATQTATVGWTIGRQAATQTITGVAINGTPQTFTNPAAPGTFTGSTSETFSTNTTTTYTIIVTTSDGKTASAATSFIYQPKRYWGRSSSTNPAASELLAAAGGGSALSTSHAGTFTITANGSAHPFFAYPSSEGTVTQIKDVNGFDVTTAFTTTTVSLTNASGYTQNYTVLTLTSATAGNYTMTTN